MHSAAIPKAPRLQTAKKNEGPSLLAADSEEEPSSDEASDMEDNRPSLLPLNEVIKGVPSSLSALLEVMIPRLQQRSGVKGVSPDDQQSFVSILVGELCSQFPDLKNQIDDPFLSPQDNKTLHRLVTVQVCRILEDLYAQYTAKAARLSDDGSLSIAAHMSRLRAQLAVQANKSVNLLVIRRQVLGQLRGPLATSHTSRHPPVPRWHPPSRPQEKTNLDSLNLGAPLSSKAGFSLTTGGSAVLRRKRVQKLAAGMAPYSLYDRLTGGPLTAGTSDSETDDVSEAVEQSVTRASSTEPTSKLTRAPSMPELYGNFLLCDWKLLTRSPYHIRLPSTHQCRENRHRALATARRASIGSSTGHDDIKWTSGPPKVKTKLGDYTRGDLNSDLCHLSEVEPAFVHTVAQDDIDPLLQASEHGLSERQRSRLAAHDQENRRKREEEERRRLEDERARREAEAEVSPTFEDMEKMHYFRSQAPQSISQSHASLHMRSNASDWQSASHPPSSHRHSLDLNSSNDILSMGETGLKVDQWSEGGGGPSLSNSLLSSAGGVSGLSLHSGPLERQSLQLACDGGPHHRSLQSHHSSLQSLSSLGTGPVSQHGSIISHKTASHRGSSGGHLDARTQHSSASSLLDMQTPSQHSRSVGSHPDTFQHGSVSSQLEMKTTPQPGEVSDVDTASWEGSSSTLETASLPRSPSTASRHGTTDLPSQQETVSNMEGALQSRPASNMDTSSYSGSSSSTLISSQHGSARSIDAALFHGSATKIESASQLRPASNMDMLSQGSSASSRHGLACTKETDSQYGSPTAHQTTASWYSSASDLNASSHGGSGSRTPSQLGSAYSIGSESLADHSEPMSASTPRTSQSKSAITFLCGGSASNIPTQTHSQHGSASTADITSRHGSASTVDTTSRHGSASTVDATSRHGSASTADTTSRHGSASTADTTSRHGSASTVDMTLRHGSARTVDTTSRYGSAKKSEVASQHGSASNVYALSDSRQGSTSTIDTASEKGSACNIEITSRKISASSLENTSQKGSVSTIEAGSRKESASTASWKGSASTMDSGPQKESASTIENGSQKESASTIGNGSQELASTDSQKLPNTTDNSSQKELASTVEPASQCGSVCNNESDSQSTSACNNEPSPSQHGSATAIPLDTTSQHEAESIETSSQYSLTSHECASSCGGSASHPSKPGSPNTLDTASQPVIAPCLTSGGRMSGSASTTLIHSQASGTSHSPVVSTTTSRQESSSKKMRLVESTEVGNSDTSSHFGLASSVETFSHHDSASNVPSRHGSISISNIETASQQRPASTSSRNTDFASCRGKATYHHLPPDTVSCPGSAASSGGFSLSPTSHHSSVLSAPRVIPDHVSQPSGGPQPLRRPQTLYPQTEVNQNTRKTMLATYSPQQKVLGGSKFSLTSRNTPPATGSRDMLEDGSGEVGGSKVSLPGSQGIDGDGGSMGGEDTSCGEGGESGGGWEDGVLGEGQSFSDMKSFSGASFSDLGSHEDVREVSEKEPEDLGPQPQPAVITSVINHQVVRSSDMCVSERAPLTTLRLQPYSPIWNELTGELDRKTVDEMDSNLTEGQEMDILYHELMKTIPKDYLDMESESSLIPALPESVDLSSVLASSSLPHRPSRRVANPDLRPVSTLAPPWGDKTKRDQWKKSNLYTGPDPKELMAPKGSTLTPAQARLRQQYQNWLKWWRSTISCDDYLKFVAQKETDYLHHLYHLYDSEGSESEGEEERERRERLVRLHSKLQAKHVRREERYKKKTQYEQGMWNVNTVMMGGLGGDPDSSGSSSEDLEDQLWELQQDTEEPELSVQERFQSVWSRLQLSQQQTMDMAAKYSSHKYQHHIRKAISLWERACTVIEEREEKLESLQSFEKSASDPSRLFAKGKDGSSNSRLNEAKRRKQINLVLDELEKKLSQLLKKLQSRYGDVITYKGRPYHEKMQHDRTELLYLLQQERRKAYLSSPPPGSPTSNTTSTLQQSL